MIRAARESATLETALSRSAASDVVERAEGPGPECATLVNGVRAGDRGSFARLYVRYAPMVHGVLLAHVSRLEAEDLVQEVFVLAWRRIGTLRDPEALGAWLAAIARRRAATHRRRAWARGLVAMLGVPHRRDAHSGAREPESRSSGVDGRIRVEELLAAIRSLPVAYRETIMLRLVEQMTGPQIAARLGMTHGSVRVKLCKGMTLLRERLKREHEE